MSLDERWPSLHPCFLVEVAIGRDNIRDDDEREEIVSRNDKARHATPTKLKVKSESKQSSSSSPCDIEGAF